MNKMNYKKNDDILKIGWKSYFREIESRLPENFKKLDIDNLDYSLLVNKFRIIKDFYKQHSDPKFIRPYDGKNSLPKVFTSINEEVPRDILSQIKPLASDLSNKLRKIQVVSPKIEDKAEEIVGNIAIIESFLNDHALSEEDKNKYKKLDSNRGADSLVKRKVLGKLHDLYATLYTISDKKEGIYHATLFSKVLTEAIGFTYKIDFDEILGDVQEKDWSVLTQKTRDYIKDKIKDQK
jgi:hypothetical protein